MKSNNSIVNENKILRLTLLVVFRHPYYLELNHSI